MTYRAIRRHISILSPFLAAATARRPGRRPIRPNYLCSEATNVVPLAEGTLISNTPFFGLMINFYMCRARTRVVRYSSVCPYLSVSHHFVVPLNWVGARRPFLYNLMPTIHVQSLQQQQQRRQRQQQQQQAACSSSSRYNGNIYTRVNPALCT